MGSIGFVELAGAAVSSGLLIHLLDRWLYRRKPELDVARLAQDIAAEALGYLRTELDDLREQLAMERADNSKLRGELDDLREQLAAARVDVKHLTSLLTSGQFAEYCQRRRHDLDY